jgi:hypothetical protein
MRRTHSDATVDLGSPFIQKVALAAGVVKMAAVGQGEANGNQAAARAATISAQTGNALARARR